MANKEKRIFVSYSHDDTQLAQLVIKSLPSSLPNCHVRIDSDFAIKPGDDWLCELLRGLSEADVGLLLVSGSFAASPFIAREELPRLKARLEAGKTRLLWVPVDQAGDEWADKNGLAALQAVARRTRIGRLVGDQFKAVLSTLEGEVFRVLDPEGFALRQSLHQKYELEEQVGEGRTWRIYRAKDTMLNRSVAIFVPVDLQLSGHNIEEWVRIACRRSLTSNVATVYGAWLKADVPHVVTQFADNGHLADAISSAREQTGRGLHCEKVRDLMLRLARTLSVEASARDADPHDVRPSKILMDKTAGYLLSPFGHWRSGPKQLRAHLASETSTLEERAYVAPEQLFSSWMADGASKDRTYQYLLGLLGWHALKGELPHAHDGVDAFPKDGSVSHVDQMPSPNADVSLCSPWLANLIVRMTSRSPEKRFDSLEEVVRRLTTAPSERMGLVRASYERCLLVNTVDAFFTRFYNNLEARLARSASAGQWEKFRSTHWTDQRAKLAEGVALLLAFHALDDDQREPTSLSRIARAHGPSGYRVDPSSFELFGLALVDTVIQTLKPGPEDKGPLEEAWNHVLEGGLSYLSRKAREAPAQAAPSPNPAMAMAHAAPSTFMEDG